PSLGRNSGVAHFEVWSSPRNGRPRRSTGSNNRARMSLSWTCNDCATWRTTSDFPMPGPPQMNTGCLVDTCDLTHNMAAEATLCFQSRSKGKEGLLNLINNQRLTPKPGIALERQHFPTGWIFASRHQISGNATNSFCKSCPLF